MLELLTDNRNRTTPEIRHLFSKHGGNLGENGCVAWLFTRKGLILIPRSRGLDEDAVMELALEAGAEDLDTETMPTISASIRTPRSSTRSRTVLEDGGVDVEAAQFEMEPPPPPASRANRRSR